MNALRRRLAKLEARKRAAPRPKYDRIVAVCAEYPGWEWPRDEGLEPGEDNPWLRISP